MSDPPELLGLLGAQGRALSFSARHLGTMSSAGHPTMRGVNKLDQVQRWPPGWVGAGGHHTGERLKEMGLFRLEEMGQGRSCGCLPPLNGCYRGDRAKLFLREAPVKGGEATAQVSLKEIQV